MKKENIDIVKAEGELIELHADEIPELAWSTGPVSYEYHMKRRSLFDASVQRSWRTPGTLFSADSAILSIREGKLLGVAIAFNGTKFKERVRALGPLWEEMLKADEVFVTSSGSLITPIVNIDDVKINSGKIGKITKKEDHNLKDIGFDKKLFSYESTVL